MKQDKFRREIGLDIRTHASPKVGQNQVSGGVLVLVLASRTRCKCSMETSCEKNLKTLHRLLQKLWQKLISWIKLSNLKIKFLYVNKSWKKDNTAHRYLFAIDIRIDNCSGAKVSVKDYHLWYICNTKRSMSLGKNMLWRKNLHERKFKC